MFESQPNSDETYAEIGIRLAKAREAAGKSAKECASVLGVPLKKYQKIENGTIIPALPEVEVLAYFLGVLPEDILENHPAEFEKKGASAEQLQQIMQLRHRILSATLQLVRSQKNLSLKETSNLSRISIARIKRYEMTSAPIPMNDLAALCKVLEISLRTLYDQSGFLAEGRTKMEKERAYLQLPVELKEFFTQSENLEFLKLAKSLKETGLENLESLAVGLKQLADKVRE
jgi:transcriptional regulator with XRE-family HTH domain